MPLIILFNHSNIKIKLLQQFNTNLFDGSVHIYNVEVTTVWSYNTAEVIMIQGGVPAFQLFGLKI